MEVLCHIRPYFVVIFPVIGTSNQLVPEIAIEIDGLPGFTY